MIHEKGYGRLTNFQSSSITGNPVILFSTRISRAVAKQKTHEGFNLQTQKIQKLAVSPKTSFGIKRAFLNRCCGLYYMQILFLCHKLTNSINLTPWLHIVKKRASHVKISLIETLTAVNHISGKHNTKVTQIRHRFKLVMASSSLPLLMLGPKQSTN